MALRLGGHAARRWCGVGVMGTSASPSRKQESRGGFSARACQGRCFMAFCPENRTAHCWGAVGSWVLPHRPTGSGKAEGFSPEPPGTLLYSSPSRKSHSPSPGRWRFRTTQPEAGKPSGFFRQSPPEALALWLSVPETAQPIAGALWGHWRFPLPSREWEPCHKRKKRRKFPPLF